MALTEIARKLKETFSGFGVSGLTRELEDFKAKYGAAEAIFIDGMAYIVINDVYKEYGDTDEKIGPLFYNSINNEYAIIDAESSSTLIEAVYSLITYMQRDCVEGQSNNTEISGEVRDAIRNLIGADENITSVETLQMAGDGDHEGNRAQIFQCQLVKDTGVSASPDVYSFMLKDGKIKEVADSALSMDSNFGKLSMLDATNIEALRRQEPAIQEAVFNKYINSDIDIQSVTVKSIFETKMAYANVHVRMQQKRGNRTFDSVFKTSHLLSEHNEFAELNQNIHTCNCCGKDLVDVVDASKKYKLHANIDAYDPEITEEAYNSQPGKRKNVTKADLLEKIVYTAGCEKCLVQCPDCQGWHFNYSEVAGKSSIFNAIHLAPGRAFVQSIRDYDINYCACREGIEWVYDEFSGSDDEHDVIPIEDMVFFNYANEKLTDFRYYEPYLNKVKSLTSVDGVGRKERALKALDECKNKLSREFNIEVESIKISSAKRCSECCVCGGLYYGRLKNSRCAICNELFDENRHMVTRVDGVVFMISEKKKKKTISRYVYTKFGNLKLIGTPKTIDDSSDSEELENVIVPEVTEEINKE